MATVFDDESDLSSLEDEDEQKPTDDGATRDPQSTWLDSDSSLTSESDDTVEDALPSSTTRANDAVPAVIPSPSRIGSGIARPAPASGLRTYAGRKARSRGGLKQQETSKSSPSVDFLGYESPLTPLPSPSPRKRRASPSANQPLSSPSKRAKKIADHNDNSAHKLQKKPASNRRTTKKGNESPVRSPSFSTKRDETSKLVVQSKGLASSISVGRRRSGSLGPKPNSSKRKAWSVETLDKMVWVRADRKNAVVDNNSVVSFWWPAMIESDVGGQEPLRVCLLFPPSGSSTSLSVVVKNPSSSNIISYKDKAFTSDSFWELPPSSTRSRPNRLDDLKSRWEAGQKKIAEEDTRLHDGFPTLTALLSQSIGYDNDVADDSVSVRASPEHVVAPSSKSLEVELWSPPAADVNVNVPGELVLSTTKNKRCAGQYYPAKVIAYVPPAGPTVPPKYTVHFMDNFSEDVTRDMFYIYEQDEFGTCKLGDFESVESFYEKDGEDDLDEDIVTETTNGIIIPELPALPAPPPEEFCELTILEQFSYIIPILTKVIENNYKPAEDRISAFLHGGRERVKMSREAPQKGYLTRLELNNLARITKCWALDIKSSDYGSRDVHSLHQPDTLDRLNRVSLSVPANDDTLLAVTSSPPDDQSNKEISQQSVEIMEVSHSDFDRIPTIPETTCQNQSNEHVSSVPPSSLPPSSAIDESPKSTPKMLSNDDLDAVVAASVEETKQFSDDHRPRNGIHSTTSQQASQLTGRSFKDLLSHEKIHFCTDVLLKEAVIQLLLWRAGKRRSPELLSETEELLLHETGSNLAGEFDIAHTVKDLRMKKEKLMQGQMSTKQQLSTGGTRSRPRKV